MILFPRAKEICLEFWIFSFSFSFLLFFDESQRVVRRVVKRSASFLEGLRVLLAKLAVDQRVKHRIGGRIEANQQMGGEKHRT